MSRPTKHKNTNELIKLGISRGESLKQLSFNLGLSLSWVYRLASELGYMAVMIDRGEAAIVSEYRKKKTTKTT